MGAVKMKRYVCADIHGKIDPLLEVLEKANFDYENDILINIGDTCDGGDYTYEVVEELLKIKNLINIVGNHCVWCRDWINDNKKPDNWIYQGGANTIDSYRKHGGVPKSHKDFFNNALDFFIINNFLFVHGGFDISLGFKNTSFDTKIWDRELILHCKNNYKKEKVIEEFDKVFVGHTQTKSKKPEIYSNLICCDSGCGWNGRASLINIDNPQEYYLSKKQKKPREILW